MDTEEIRKLAALARLSATDDELKGLSKDLSSILEYVSAIQSAGLEPGDGSLESTHERVNVFRDDSDQEEPGVHTEALLGETPERDRNWVKVKKIIGERE